MEQSHQRTPGSAQGGSKAEVGLYLVRDLDLGKSAAKEALLPSAPAHRAPYSVTVVVPTYREAQNLPHLIRRLDSVRNSVPLDLEICLIDDDSQDGSDGFVQSLGLPWVRLVTRKARRGLSESVLEGLGLATRDFIVVMDADLSHPPEKIPELLDALENGADLAVGSRFTEGGSTADDWGPVRWLNSRIATLLAYPLTRINDPMSGYFAIRRESLVGTPALNPVGYKILLEIIVKCKCRFVTEIPIHFENRRYGSSKLSLREQIKYFRHLRRLYMHRYGEWSHLAQFLSVGLSGMLVNLLVLTGLLAADIASPLAVALAIAVSMLWNFLLNRRFTFSYARGHSFVRQFGRYVAACSVGALVNYVTTNVLTSPLHSVQAAAATGVLAGTVFNYVASRFLVFQATYVKRR